MKVENQYIVYELKDGILYAEFKYPVLIDMKMAQLLVHDRLKLCDGRDYPTCYELKNFEYADREVRNYMSTEEGLSGIKAGAFYTKSIATKTFFNFYLAVFKPKVPAKVFSNKEKAVQWLKQFVEEQV